MSTGKKALIVDDDETIQKLLTRLCQLHGVDADAVSSFGEVEDLFKNGDQCYDIYFLDLILPGASGWDILGLLREIDSAKDKPVIVISGASLSEDERNKLLQKADYIILKQSFSVRMFKDVLQRFLKIDVF